MKNLYSTVNRTLLLMVLLLATLSPYCASAQNRTVSGIVTDSEGKPLAEVLVDTKSSLAFTMTDSEGRFSLSVPRPGKRTAQALIFTLEGYAVQTVVLGAENELRVVLLPDTAPRDQDVRLMYGTQKRSLLTSAVASVGGSDMQDIPVMFQNAALSGKLLGVQVIQESGAPGQDNADIYLRGRRSWRNRNPLVFVDGHRRDFSLVDPHEIEYVSAYKDAGALAIFGLRGGNGALMATTRRGHEGRPVLKFNAQVNFQSPTHTPDFLDSYHFAVLHNEAQLNDNPSAVPNYSDEDLRLYRTGESPLTHPNVDWLKECLKRFTVSQKYNLSVEGGSSAARYFVNISYLNNDGLYKTDKDANTYNTNADFQMYSIRSNVDVNITRTTTLAVNLYGRQRLQNNPGGTTNSNEMFNTLYSLPSNIFPVTYDEGRVAGTNEFRKNPYGILNYSGYSKYIHSTMEASMELREHLDYFIPGLSVYGSLAFDARFDNTINRSKSYFVYQYDGVDEATGEVKLVQWGEEQKQNNSNSFGTRIIRIFDIEAGLNYDRTFGRHTVQGALIFNNNQESDDTYKLTNTHQGLFGRATYAYDSRYIAEFSFGYQGTEQLPASGRYGFFPAGSVGWVVTQEPFMRGSAAAAVLSTLKVRASWGLAGNDDGIPYFYYMPSFKLNSSNRFNFGTTGTAVGGWVENGLFNENVTYERSEKINVGVDLGLFKNKLMAEFNWFDERTSQILTTRTSVSTLLGMGSGTGPLGNVGRTTNRGFELGASYTDRAGSLRWTVGGMFTYAHNNIDFNDEQTYEYSYRQTYGHPINDVFGYVANGLYKNEQDMLNSPLTTFGPAYAGDIKYRDLNGDGVVDIQDQKRIARNNLAEKVFSMYLGLNWKGFDLNVTFSGVANRNYYVKGVGILAFTNVSGSGGPYDGNVLQYHWDNRYNPRDPSTWETATYPRLSLAGRNHNSQQSSFWVEDGTYLRLKNLQVGYTLPRRITKGWYISRARIFYSGYNLFTWHRMRTVDPESSPNATNYPVQCISSIGINIEF